MIKGQSEINPSVQNMDAHHQGRLGFMQTIIFGAFLEFKGQRKQPLLA